jgi:hypothetical protein
MIPTTTKTTELLDYFLRLLSIAKEWDMFSLKEQWTVRTTMQINEEPGVTFKVFHTDQELAEKNIKAYL